MSDNFVTNWGTLQSIVLLHYEWWFNMFTWPAIGLPDSCKVTMLLKKNLVTYLSAKTACNKKFSHNGPLKGYQEWEEASVMIDYNRSSICKFCNWNSSRLWTLEEPFRWWELSSWTVSLRSWSRILLNSIGFELILVKASFLSPNDFWLESLQWSTRSTWWCKPLDCIIAPRKAFSVEIFRIEKSSQWKVRERQITVRR